MWVTKSFENDIFLISSFFSDGAPEHLHDKLLIEESWTILSLIKLISHLCGQIDVPNSPGWFEQLAPLAVVLDMLLNNLVSRDVDHVEFDCQVGTSRVDTQTLFVVQQDNLWREFANQILFSCLKRLIRIEIDGFTACTVIRQIMSHRFDSCVNISNLFIDHFFLLGRELLRLSFFAPSVLQILLICRQTK